jgi:hypothetical protein
MNSNKIVLLSGIFFCFQTLISVAADEKESSPFSVRFTGFVKSDYWLDSRSVVAAREDLFLLFPRREKTDAQGHDIYGDPVFNFSAITSRVAAYMAGPDAFGARVSGLIEADFSGVSNSDINGLRLRHAYVQLQWEHWGLMLGHWWHPMFSVDVVPRVVSLNTGAPFQPFIRSPQATLTYRKNHSLWLFSLLSQRDNSSDGPGGASPDYLRNTALPNAHLHWMGSFGHFTAGLAADYKVLRPRLETTQGLYTDETFGTYAFMTYGRYRRDLFDVKAKAIYGQNLSEHLMLGGYAESTIDPVTGQVAYTPLRHISFWGNVLYGEQIQAGLFLGFTKNLGAEDEVAGSYYGRGSDIAYLYRIAPSVSVTSGKVRLCGELEYTVAAYGDPDHRGRIKDFDETGNLRLLFTALYYF